MKKQDTPYRPPSVSPHTSLLQASSQLVLWARFRRTESESTAQRTTGVSLHFIRAATARQTLSIYLSITFSRHSANEGKIHICTCSIMAKVKECSTVKSRKNKVKKVLKGKGCGATSCGPQASGLGIRDNTKRKKKRHQKATRSN